MKIDLDQIRDLLAVVGQTDISELTIESGDQKITIKKSGTTYIPTTVEVQAATPLAQAKPLEPVVPDKQLAATVVEERSSTNGLVPIASPMVGTFYRSPAPTAPAFVDVGDRITSGQTVCIIEAMKLMNDLPAEISGRIVQVCAENGTTVEYGQPLFLVDPNG